MNSQAVMALVVQAADEKHAHELTALDMQAVSLMADYFVIADAETQRQVNAIVDNILEQAEAAQVKVNHVEGQKNSQWILIDLGDVIVHIFTHESREFYQIEKLWSDATVVNITTLLKKA